MILSTSNNQNQISNKKQSSETKSVNKYLYLLSSRIFIKIIPVLFLFASINCGEGIIILFDKEISQRELISIEILPASATIRDIDNLQFIAIGTFSDSSTPDITDQVTWSSSGAGLVTISNSAGSEGLATGVADGTAAIQAAMGSVTGSADLTLTHVASWELEVTTTDTNQNMTIDFGGTVNMRVYWGDGAVNNTTAASITHTYSSAGTYTLQLKGMASRIYFDNTDANSRLTNILSVVRGIEGLTSFAYTFRGCMELTSIPAGLFDNCPLVTNFTLAFAFCSGITSIPDGLFDYNTNVTTFQAVFRESGVTAIPPGLFDNNTLVTDMQGMFFRCTGLTGEIPAGLFDYNTQVTNFSHTFEYCSGLTSVPSDLFDNNTLVTTFGSAFSAASGITSAVPTLWVSHPGSEHTNTFLGVTDAENYDDIPPEWK